MRRRAFASLTMLTGCGSVLPDRPFQEVRRHTLAPERPTARVPAPRGPVLLVRAFRAAPGLDQAGLRRVGADGVVVNAPYEEWVAPPAELAEAALRRWLASSGLFQAVVAPGSRLEATLVLEAELSRLELVPAAGEVRATIAGVLLAEPPARERVLRQFVADGAVAVPSGPVPSGQVPSAPAAAAAMREALAAAFARVEAELAAALPGRRVA